MKLADGAQHVDEAKRLIREYVEWFGRDLAFQGLDDELAHVGDKYLPPAGRLEPKGSIPFGSLFYNPAGGGG